MEWIVPVISGTGEVFRLPGPRSKPKIRPSLQTEPKAIAGRFCQLLSGHAMMAPFLKEKWGRIESNQCRWCHRGRRIWEQPFKECERWRKEIHGYGKRRGTSGQEETRGKRDRRTERTHSEEQERIRVWHLGSKARPSNAAVRELMGNEADAEAAWTGAQGGFLCFSVWVWVPCSSRVFTVYSCFYGSGLFSFLGVSFRGIV